MWIWILGSEYSLRDYFTIVPGDALAGAFWKYPWLDLNDIGFPDNWSAAEIYAWQVARALTLGPELVQLFGPRTQNPGGLELFASLVIRLVVDFHDLTAWLTNAAIEQRPEDPEAWLAELRQTWVLLRLGA
jgi:hypothetical protein